MYLSYEEYRNMGGMLDETAFSDFEYDARTYIDWYTFNRLENETEIPDKVKECMYHLIKILALQQELLNGGTSSSGSESTAGISSIASQSNDGVSVSYNVVSAKDILDDTKTEIGSLIQRYLQGVRNSLGRKLLYRGLYPYE